MKIDIKRLQKVTMQISSQNLPGGLVIDNSITLDALNLMVKNVLNHESTPYALAPNNIKVAIDTLTELKILVADNKSNSPVIQLNS
jgi:predicted RNA-binding protein Jag